MAGWWSDPGKPAIWGMTDEPQPQADPVPPQPSYAFPVGGSMAGKSWADVPRDGGKVNSRWFGGPRAGGRHAGIDIPGKAGDPVLAPAGGKVIRVGQGQGYGNMIDVMAPDGSVHRYAHLSAIGVRQGDELKPGQAIGSVGFSGNAGPEFPHLHYEVFPSAGAYGASAGLASRSAWARREDPSEYWAKAGGQAPAAPATQTAAAPANSPVFSAYSPQARGSRMEGGYAAARPGPDGQAVVRTFEDWRDGRSPYVTAAGDPSQYDKRFTVPEMPYWNGKYDQNGNKIITNYKDVPFVVHDTGSAFKGKGDTRFDIPVARDVGNRFMNGQPWSMRPVAISDQPGATVAQAPQPQRQQVAGIVVDEPQQPAPQQQPTQQPVQTPVERAQVATTETPKFQAPAGLGGPKDMAFPDDFPSNPFNAATPYAPVARMGLTVPQNSVTAARGGGPVISQVPGQPGSGQPGDAGGWQDQVIGNIPVQTAMERNRAMADQLAKLAYQKEGPRHWLEGLSRTGAAIGSEYFASEADKKENASRQAEVKALLEGRIDSPQNRALAYLLIHGKGADAAPAIQAALAPQPVTEGKDFYGNPNQRTTKTPSPIVNPPSGAPSGTLAPRTYAPPAGPPTRPAQLGGPPTAEEAGAMGVPSNVPGTSVTPPNGKMDLGAVDPAADERALRGEAAVAGATPKIDKMPRPASDIGRRYGKITPDGSQIMVQDGYPIDIVDDTGRVLPAYALMHDKVTMAALGNKRDDMESARALRSKEHEAWDKKINGSAEQLYATRSALDAFEMAVKQDGGNAFTGTGAGVVNWIKKFGNTYGIGEGATAAQIIDKLGLQLSINADQALAGGAGNRVTNFMAQTGLKNTPNVEMSPEANMLLLHRLRKMNEFANGTLPAVADDYIEMKARHRADPYLDAGVREHIKQYMDKHPLDGPNDETMMAAAGKGANAATLQKMIAEDRAGRTIDRSQYPELFGNGGAGAEGAKTGQPGTTKYQLNGKLYVAGPDGKLQPDPSASAAPAGQPAAPQAPAKPNPALSGWELPFLPTLQNEDKPAPPQAPNTQSGIQDFKDWAKASKAGDTSTYAPGTKPGWKSFRDWLAGGQ